MVKGNNVVLLQSGKTARLERPVRITEQVWPEGTAPVATIRCMTYNHANFIRDALEGFLMQETSFPVQILVHDDASEDGTRRIVQEYCRQYPRLITGVLQQENQWSKGIKPSNALNHLVRGEFVALCEGDDYWVDPRKLECQIDFLIMNPEFVGCFTDFVEVDEAGNVTNRNGLVPERKRNYDHLTVLSSYTPKTATAVFRKPSEDLLASISKIRVTNGDTVFWSFLTQSGPAAYIDRVTAAYRRHDGGMWSAASEMARCESQLAMCRELFRHFRTKPERLAISERLRRFYGRLCKIYGTRSLTSRTMYEVGVVWEIARARFLR
jgi:glycosyltransferase involved in cell wall biosynthesis